MPAFETKEQLKERPALTVYLIRHGESGKNKINPNRGLTDKGHEQVKIAFNKIINQIIADEVPDFKDWDKPEARAAALKQAMEKVAIHLRDSGTNRTIEQEWVEKEVLTSLGVKPEQINLPDSAYEWQDVARPQTAGPGIQKRLKGVQGLETNKITMGFRKKIGDKKYQKSLGASDEIVAWALTPEDKIPEGVENVRQMSERKNRDLAKVERIAAKLGQRDKRIIYVANSHASILSLSAADELGIPLPEVGEVENAEGLRLDFYSSGKKHEARPVGEKIEELVKDKRKE